LFERLCVIRRRNKVKVKVTNHQKFETHGVDIFYCEKDKIKEAWTIYDALKPALQICIVGSVQPVQSENLYAKTFIISSKSDYIIFGYAGGGTKS
jgi:hypothetical protein